MQNRLKSPVFWGAVVAQILSILVLVGALNQLVSETIQAVAASILQLLVVLGLLNNPTDAEHF